MAQAKDKRGKSGSEAPNAGGIENASTNKNTTSPGEKQSQRETPREPRGATGRNEQMPSAKSAQHEHINRNERDHSKDLSGEYEKSARDLNSLEEEEELAGSRRGLSSYSETDEDEDEGLGDGNIGRSTRSRGLDEEG